MNIALLTDTWHPYTNGVITHIDVLAQGLRALGHNVLILASDPQAKRHYQDPSGVLHCPGFTLKKIYGYGIALPFSRERQRLLKEFHPQVIHIHNEFGMGTYGWIASRLLKVPLVYTLHTAYDDYLHYLAPRPFLPIVRFLSRSYVRFLANSARQCTGPSEKAAVYLRARKVKSPFSFIPNSVDLQHFDPQNISKAQRADLRQRLGIGEDQITGIFVGRLGKEKGVDLLLEHWKPAAEENPRLHLLIVGDGPLRPDLEAAVHDLGLTGRVTFPGKIPYEDIPQYYSAADFFVSASVTEMMSIALLEARAMGLPALQRLDPLSSHQVTDQVHGYVYTDAGTFYNGLRAFLQLRDQGWSDWKARCRQQIARQGAEDLAEKLLEVYEKALSS